MDLISLIGMAQSIQHCGHMRSECELGFETCACRQSNPGHKHGRLGWLMPLHYMPTGSLLNDIKITVHDHGELQMHLLRQSEYGQAGIPECPGLLTPSRHKRCVLMAIRVQM
jgi:hypothetical protein